MTPKEPVLKFIFSGADDDDEGGADEALGVWREGGRAERLQPSCFYWL